METGTGSSCDRRSVGGPIAVQASRREPGRRIPLAASPPDPSEDPPQPDSLDKSLKLLTTPLGLFLGRLVTCEAVCRKTVARRLLVAVILHIIFRMLEYVPCRPLSRAGRRAAWPGLVESRDHSHVPGLVFVAHRSSSASTWRKDHIS